MSLAAIKIKETKGKKNALPKLRTILANPYKQHSPVLSDSELLEFRDILKAAINESEHALKTFPTKAHIHLGLESSLRAINGKRFSCVFVSLSLRPSHLVRLIATSAAVMAPMAPIYAQPKLEELTHELFGVRTLIMVLPLDLVVISPRLDKWVNLRRKPLVPPKLSIVRTQTTKPQKPKAQEVLNKEPLKPQVAMPAVEKQWSGDYISCSNDKGALSLEQVDVQIETQQLSSALSKLLKKSKAQTKAEVAIESTELTETLPTVEHMDLDKEEDEDEFLPAQLRVYQPLTVHQVRSNPDKKLKKKRTKNKTEKQNKNATNL